MENGIVSNGFFETFLGVFDLLSGLDNTGDDGIESKSKPLKDFLAIEDIFFDKAGLFRYFFCERGVILSSQLFGEQGSFANRIS